MENTKETKRASVNDLDFVYPNYPITHIFYEYQGERSVDPIQLVMNGELLWSEQAHNNLEHKREILKLWNDAENLLTKRHSTPTHSYVEWLRYQITMGIFDPEKSLKKHKPYAYRGMLISAIYLQEANRLCSEGQIDRAWHVISLAYYYLGMSTTPSSRQNAARAAKVAHKEDVELRRALVLVPLEIIGEQQKKRPTIRSIDEAIDAVINFIYSNKKILAELKQLDAKTLNCKDTDDALDRFRNLLYKWASPNGPHPDIAKAFSVYAKRKYKSRAEMDGPGIPGSAIDPGVKHYMRLIHLMENGDVLTLEVSRDNETPEVKSNK